MVLGKALWTRVERCTVSGEFERIPLDDEKRCDKPGGLPEIVLWSPFNGAVVEIIFQQPRAFRCSRTRAFHHLLRVL